MIDFALKLQKLQDNNLYRYKEALTTAQGVEIIIGGKKLINFSSNDYLSLANDNTIKQSFINAVKKYGVGSGASHLLSGHFQAHEDLEKALADYLQCEKVLLFSTGYMANLGVFSALRDDIDWVLQDKLNHASLIDANFLINIDINRYPHKNLLLAEKKLQKLSKNNNCGLIASDVVFSMDGDNADVKALQDMAKRYNSYLLLDGAHSFAIKKTKLTAETIYMATLGKALGTMGAFVGGSYELIEYLMQKSRPFIYTTAIAPALACASITSLEIIKKGHLQQKLVSNIKYFKDIAKLHNIQIQSSNTAIQPIIIGDNAKLLTIVKKMRKLGFLLGAIRYPTVAKNTARLRISINAGHSKKHIKLLLETFAQT